MARATKDQLKDRLENIRETRGWTVTEMAQKCGVSRGAMEKYLKGTAKPGYDAIASISRACRVSPAWIVFGDEGERFEILPAQVGEIAREVAQRLLNDIALHVEYSQSDDKRRRLAQHLRDSWPDVFAYKMSEEYGRYFVGEKMPRLHPIWGGSDESDTDPNV